VHEQIEDLRLDVDDSVGAFELPPVGVDREIAELEQQVIEPSRF